MIELFLTRRNELNSVIEGNARLCFLLPVFNTQKVMAAIEFCRKQDNGTITFSDYYFFHFSRVASITIGTLQSQYFPTELKRCFNSVNPIDGITPQTISGSNDF